MKRWALQRDIPIEGEYDLLVAGGGPAGIGAAVAAAREGLKVLLLEATGCLGGMATSGLVAVWGPLSDGVRVLPRGVFWEVLSAAAARGCLPQGTEIESFHGRLGGGTGYEVEGVKRILDELCHDAGVRVLLGTRLVEADADRSRRRVHGAVIHNVEGLRYVAARSFVDATGDAVLAHLCGAECREAGRDTGHIMPATLCATCVGIDWERFYQHHDSQDQAIERAIKDGFFTQPDRHVPGLFRSAGDYGILNAGHLFEMDALKAEPLSRGYELGRRLAAEYTEFFRRYMPGCEGIRLIATAPLMGVRESRRIVGESELQYDAFRQRRHVPDQIALTNAAVDIHVYDTSDEQWQRYCEEFRKRDRCAAGESYGLPYGILVPRGWQNLWAAGRCVSADLKMHGAIRLQPTCMMMGQAAGAAAAQSLRSGEAAPDIAIPALLQTLRRQGAYLPQSDSAPVPLPAAPAPLPAAAAAAGGR